MKSLQNRNISRKEYQFLSICDIKIELSSVNNIKDNNNNNNYSHKRIAALFNNNKNNNNNK